MAGEVTKAVDLINPEVMMDAVAAKLPKKIRFVPFAKQEDTLVGVAGDTITRPKYGYIGPAEDLQEGVPVDLTKMSMTTTQVTIKEVGKAVEITDRAILTNLDGTLGEAENQLAMSLADKIDADYLETLGTSVLSYTATAWDPDNILGAIKVLNDEDQDDYILFINNQDYHELIASLIGTSGNVQQTALAQGTVAELVGVKHIVRTKRLAPGTAYIQKPEAMEIVNKRRAQIKKAEDIMNRSVVLVANQYYITNLINDKGVVKITKSAD